MSQPRLAKCIRTDLGVRTFREEVVRRITRNLHTQILIESLDCELDPATSIGRSRMSGRRTSGSSRPSLGVQVLAVFSFISWGKSQFEIFLGEHLEVPDILLPDIRGILNPFIVNASATRDIETCFLYRDYPMGVRYPHVPPRSTASHLPSGGGGPTPSFQHLDLFNSMRSAQRA